MFWRVIVLGIGLSGSGARSQVKAARSENGAGSVAERPDSERSKMSLRVAVLMVVLGVSSAFAQRYDSNAQSCQSQSSACSGSGQISSLPPALVIPYPAVAVCKQPANTELAPWRFDSRALSAPRINGRCANCGRSASSAR